MKKSTYPKPSDLSKTQLNRIGDKIRTGNASNSDIESLDTWRASHLYPMNTFRVTLIEKTKHMPGRIIAQRLKRLPTIIQKLEHEEEMELSRMQDVGGLRAILKSNSEVYKLAKYYNSKKLSHPIKRFDDYIKTPRNSGYRGIHLVFEYKSTQSRNAIAKRYDGLLLELQLRTELQHLWATSVEVAGLSRSEKLKNGYGNQDWLKFFKLVSMVFHELEAADEPNYLSSNTNQKQINETVRDIKEIDKTHRVLEQLSAFSESAKVVTQQLGRGKYAIIALDLVEHHVKIFAYSEKNYAEALSKYADLEKGQEFSDQVLVSVGALKQLEKAYPNYFVDIKKFIERVREIIDIA